MTTRFALAAERPELNDLTPVAIVHAYGQVERMTACGRTLDGLHLFDDRRWPPPANRGLARCRDCDHAVVALETAGEPLTPPMVTVEWLRSTSDGAATVPMGHPPAGGCHIGDRVYRGRAGEQARIRADDAESLAASGFVKRVASESS